MLNVTPAHEIERVNRKVFYLTAFVNVGLLLLAALVDSWALKIGIAILFSFTNNTMFSLLHEAVHGSFSDNPKTNRIFGILTSAFFPTVYDFQKRVHLAHHKNNRSRLEQFDLIRENDIKWLKYSQWYAILTGIYWCFPVLGVFVLAVAPNLLTSKLWTKFPQFSEQVGTISMFSPLQKTDLSKIRWQAVWTLSFQVFVLFLMGWQWQTWLLCYAFFGINWSSLQYADHAWSPLDPIEGAWNLRVPGWVHFFFLNYHFHKVHHEHPSMSWMDLKNNVNAKDPNPTFYEIYKEMWKGPKHLNQVKLDETQNSFN